VTLGSSSLVILGDGASEAVGGAEEEVEGPGNAGDGAREELGVTEEESEGLGNATDGEREEVEVEAISEASGGKRVGTAVRRSFPELGYVKQSLLKCLTPIWKLLCSLSKGYPSKMGFRQNLLHASAL
jgi:hypothetical protein